MSDDLIEKLRWSAASTEVSEELTAYGTLLDAAATEIERLRERCEAYKGQVEAGSHMIERLRAIVSRMQDLPLADIPTKENT